MDTNLVKNIEKNANQLFVDMNMKEASINNKPNFRYKNGFYRFSFVSGLKSFVLEFAESWDDALKNRYEDSELYYLDLGEKNILAKLEHDIKTYIIE